MNETEIANPRLLRDIEDLLNDELGHAEIDIHALALQLLDTVTDSLAEGRA